MTTPDRDPLEDRLSAAFRDAHDNSTDPDDFLSDVRHGARRRRTRRTIVGATTAVLLVVGGGAVVAQAGLFGDKGAPVADHLTPTAIGATNATNPTGPTQSSEPTQGTSPTEATGPTSSKQNTATGSQLGGVLALTSTGSEAQWAMVASSGVGCGTTSCALVIASPVGTDAWAPLPDLRAPVGTDVRSADSVTQLRFAGTAGDRYNGWAFGGDLLSTHTTAADEDHATWHEATQPWMDGPVTALEAHGDVVYAVVSGPTPTLISSPVDDDAWQPVDTHHALHDVSQLAVSEGVVALLDHRDQGSDILTLDAGAWDESDPCDGNVTELSTAATTLWALCDDGTSSTVWQRSDDSTTWSQAGTDYASGAKLAGRSVDSALVATPDGLFEVQGDSDTRVNDQDFTQASMFGFTNADVGFVIEDGVVYRTDDGGSDWQQVDVG